MSRVNRKQRAIHRAIKRATVHAQRQEARTICAAQREIPVRTLTNPVHYVRLAAYTCGRKVYMHELRQPVITYKRSRITL